MKKYEEARGNMIKFQALCRGYLMRQKIAEQLKAVCVIQAYARGMFVRKTLHKMKKVGSMIGSMEIGITAQVLSIEFVQKSNFDDGIK